MSCRTIGIESGSEKRMAPADCWTEREQRIYTYTNGAAAQYRNACRCFASSSLQLCLGQLVLAFANSPADLDESFAILLRRVLNKILIRHHLALRTEYDDRAASILECA
jgi:hypothetical protein